MVFRAFVNSIFAIAGPWKVLRKGIIDRLPSYSDDIAAGDGLHIAVRVCFLALFDQPVPSQVR